VAIHRNKNGNRNRNKNRMFQKQFKKPQPPKLSTFGRNCAENTPTHPISTTNHTQFKKLNVKFLKSTK
jgi:hypothetical protein